MRSTHEKIFICRNRQHLQAADGRFLEQLDALLAAVPLATPGDLRALIRQLVPEYTPSLAMPVRQISRAANVPANGPAPDAGVSRCVPGHSAAAVGS